MRILLAGLSAILIAGAMLATPDHDDMVRIEAGPVELGAPDKNSLPGPAIYQVAGFLIDRHEVSNAQYGEFVRQSGRAPAAFSDDDEFNQPGQPVTGVTWDDANAFCKWAGKRLPSEVEWEKAARSGDGRIYPWGNKFKTGFAQLSGDKPMAISAYPPEDRTPQGLVGMAGGVSEWVDDVQFASGGVCGRTITTQPAAADAAADAVVAGAGGNDRSRFKQLLANGGELASFAPLCLSGRKNLSAAVTAHNNQMSMALAKLGKPGWGMQKCAYIKGNSFNGRAAMTRLTNRMWDYADSVAEFVGFRCARSVN